MFTKMRYLVIPGIEAINFKQVRLVWWWGIDPVEIADGTFILNEDCYNLIENFPVRTVTINSKDLTVENALKVYPLVDEKDIVFKTYEVEPIITKKI